MIERRIPQKIILDDGRCLFSAISLAGNTLVLIGTYYFDQPIDYRRVGLQLLPATASLSVKTNILRVDYEPCYVLTLQLRGNPSALHVSYEGKAWEIPLVEEATPPGKIGLMTLLKHDYQLIPEFVRHYLDMGVTSFCFYYNGRLADVDWSFLNQTENTFNATIRLIEWDISYFWDVKEISPIPAYDEQGYQHHAQDMAMNHYLHTAKNSSEYSFFVDLDEFVFTPKPFIDDACKQGVRYLRFRCWWAMPMEAASPSSFSCEDDTPLAIAECTEAVGRSKCLVKLSEVNLMGVHHPFDDSRGEAVVDGFLHIRGLGVPSVTGFPEELSIHAKPCTKRELVPVISATKSIFRQKRTTAFRRAMECRLEKFLGIIANMICGSFAFWGEAFPCSICGCDPAPWALSSFRSFCSM